MFKKALFTFALLCIIASLFIKIDTIISLRFMIAIWPFGHVIAFALPSFLLLSYCTKIKVLPPSKQFLVLTFLCFGLGGAIELIQPYFSRSAEVEDLLFNYLGVLVAFLFFGNHSLHWLLKATFIVGLGLFFNKSILIIADEIKFHAEFPILSTFEREIELTRWRANLPLSIEQPVPEQPNKMLKISFAKSERTGVTLRDFNKQWSEYSTLTMQFYNPNKIKTPVRLVITDNEFYKSEPTHKNRYQKVFQILPGQQQIGLSLKEVKNGVELRELNLEDISSLGLYINNPKSTTSLYLDSIYLE